MSLARVHLTVPTVANTVAHATADTAAPLRSGLLRLSLGALLLLGLGSLPSGLRAQEDPNVLRPGELDINVPAFESFEVEYTSAFGRFFNEIRPFEEDGVPKISILNLIEMPTGVIVDSKAIDRETLRLEYFMSPFFAWGQEYVVGQRTEAGMEWVRVPLGGGTPIRTTASDDFGEFMDDLGFSPTLAAVLPLPVGTRFQMPGMQPLQDGSLSTVWIDYEVMGRETLTLQSGVQCACWVVEQTDAVGGRHRFWVSREAPFVFKRHRDIGGPRDFVSEVLSFRSY